MDLSIILFIYCSLITLYLIKKIFESKNDGNNKLLEELVLEVTKLKKIHDDQNIVQSEQITQIKQNFTQLTQLQDDFQKKLLNTQMKLISHMNKSYSQKTNSMHNNSISSINKDHSTDSGFK